MKERTRIADERDGEMSARPMSKWKLARAFNAIQCDPVCSHNLQICIRDFVFSCEM